MQIALRVPDADAVRREIVRWMETGLNHLLLPPGEYPDYVDVFVHYPEVLAKIRIYIKEPEELQ